MKQPRLGKLSLFNLLDCKGMIRKLDNGEYRLYSKKKKGNRFYCKNLGTFSSLYAAKRFERDY